MAVSEEGISRIDLVFSGFREVPPPAWTARTCPRRYDIALSSARPSAPEAPLEALSPWFVVAHLVGLVLFAICHGASAFMAFRLRNERDPVVVDSLLKVGQLSVGPMYVGLLLLIVGGLGVAASANLWGQPWILASIGAGRPPGDRTVGAGADARYAATGHPDPGRNRGAGVARLADGHQARLIRASLGGTIACAHPWSCSWPSAS